MVRIPTNRGMRDDKIDGYILEDMRSELLADMERRELDDLREKILGDALCILEGASKLVVARFDSHRIGEVEACESQEGSCELSECHSAVLLLFKVELHSR